MDSVPSQNGARTFPARNPRRRVRKETDETGSLRLQPLRKRHRTTANGSHSAYASSELINGHTSPDGSPSSSNLDLTIRERNFDSKKREDPSANTLDIFAKNENYCVGQIPSLPKVLRGKREGRRQIILSYQ